MQTFFLLNFAISKIDLILLIFDEKHVIIIRPLLLEITFFKPFWASFSDGVYPLINELVESLITVEIFEFFKTFNSLINGFYITNKSKGCNSYIYFEDQVFYVLIFKNKKLLYYNFFLIEKK